MAAQMSYIHSQLAAQDINKLNDHFKKLCKACINPVAFWLMKLPCGFILLSHLLHLNVGVSSLISITDAVGA